MVRPFAFGECIASFDAVDNTNRLRTCQAPSQIFKLGLLPTPVHRWHVEGIPDNVELWIKRDDLSGMQLSGNKVALITTLFPRPASC